MPGSEDAEEWRPCASDGVPEPETGCEQTAADQAAREDVRTRRGVLQLPAQQERLDRGCAE